MTGGIGKRRDAPDEDEGGEVRSGGPQKGDGTTLWSYSQRLPEPVHGRVWVWVTAGMSLKGSSPGM